MLRRGLSVVGEAIFPGKLEGGGNPGYSNEHNTAHRSNPLTPLILPWKAVLFILSHIMIILTMTPIFAAFCAFFEYFRPTHSAKMSNPEVSGQVFIDTMKIYYESRMDELYSHFAWWKVKQLIFHAIMISRYFHHLVINLGRNIIVPAIVTLAAPLIPLSETTT